MNAIFICVIVLDKMCFHMLNLCWFKHKKIFECFRCFWKVFCFYKTWKISKNSAALFWRLNRGSSKSHATIASSRVSFGHLFVSERSSRKGYTEIFATQLATPSRVRLLVTKNTWQIFSNLLAWSVLAGVLATNWRLVSVANNACFAFQRKFLKLF